MTTSKKTSKKILIRLTSNLNSNETVALARLKIQMPQEIKVLIVSKLEAESCARRLQISSLKNLRLPNCLIKLGYILQISK